MKKHQFTDENFEPAIAERIKNAMTKLLDQHLAEIEYLAANPIEDKSRVDTQSSNMGKHWLENRKGYEAAMAARTRRIRELAYSVDYIVARLSAPKITKAEAADPRAAKRAALEALMKDIDEDDDDDSTS